MMLIHGLLFEGAESYLSLWGQQSVGPRSCIYSEALPPFSRSFSGYPGFQNSPPKWLLAHLLHLNVLLSWSVLLRMSSATNMHILGPQRTKGGCGQWVGVMHGYEGWRLTDLCLRLFVLWVRCRSGK